MFENRPARPVQKRLDFFQDTEVARLFEVFVDGQDEPERVVAMFGEFALAVAVEMVVDLAVGRIWRDSKPDPFPGFGRDRR